MAAGTGVSEAALDAEEEDDPEHPASARQATAARAVRLRGVRRTVGSLLAGKDPRGGIRGDQWKDSPQAQLPAALGLSMVKPCFSMVSAKSMVAPDR